MHPDEKISVTVRVRRRKRRKGSRDLPTIEYWDGQPKSGAKGARVALSRREFSASYGASDGDIDAVVRFAESLGLTVGSVHPARRNIVLTGAASRMMAAFRVDLAQFECEDCAYRGREGSIYIPEGLVPIVEGIFGLDNRRMAKRAAMSGDQALLTPPQVAQLYNFPSGNASGQTIGILEFGACGYQVADILNYFNAPGYVAPQITDVGVSDVMNAPGRDLSADGEVTADIDLAASVAQGAAIVVYFAPWDEQGWVQSVSTAIHPDPGQPAPSILSISCSWPELSAPAAVGGLQWTTAAIKAVSDCFQDAASLTEGVTVLAASGDWGSDCGVGDAKAHVCYPASDPWVTSCGGTKISGISGLTPIEGTWSDVGGATGGGLSTVFDVLVWQRNIRLPDPVNPGQASGRGIPDVAGHVGPYPVLLNGARNSIIGTSLTAPLYAGLIALLNASLGRRVGYLNPALYKLADAGVFIDICDGVNNSFHGSPGYESGPGWDACTGLGTVNGSNLMAALQASGS